MYPSDNYDLRGGMGVESQFSIYPFSDSIQNLNSNFGSGLPLPRQQLRRFPGLTLKKTPVRPLLAIQPARHSKVTWGRGGGGGGGGGGLFSDAGSVTSKAASL